MAGFLKRLFGGSDDQSTSSDGATRSPDEVHGDVEIRATPIKEAGGQWRIAGTLTKNSDVGEQVRKFVRADLVQSQEEAVVASISKAKMIIDQNGSSLWSGDENRPV